jgi:hypothetical protein
MKRDEMRAAQKRIATMTTQIDEMREEESAMTRRITLKNREKDVCVCMCECVCVCVCVCV